MAEFYSANLAMEANKGVTQKVKQGGTPNRAPLGYLNIRVMRDGRKVNTVTVDPERGPLIAWAFDAYATGDWSLRRLCDELTVRGLTTRPTPRYAAKPVRPPVLHEILRNPYYKGIVTFRGAMHEGKHEPLVDPATWRRVQDVLAAHVLGDRRREHDHYLKSSLFCEEWKAVLISEVEDLVEDHYATVVMPAKVRDQILAAASRCCVSWACRDNNARMWARTKSVLFGTGCWRGSPTSRAARA